MATLKDVAQAAGVSTVTASSVLSGVNRVRVSTDTAIRIKEVANNLNYVPLAAARGLRTGNTGVIAFLASSVYEKRCDNSWQEMLRGISDILGDYNSKLMLGIPKDEEDELDMVRQLAFGKQVDGFIIQEPRDKDERLEIIKAAERQVVTIGGKEVVNVNRVAFDNKALGYKLATEFSQECGALLVIMPNSSDDIYSADLAEGISKYGSENQVAVKFWQGAFLPEKEIILEVQELSKEKPLGIILMRGLLPELISELYTCNLNLGSKSYVLYVSNFDEILMPPFGLKVLALDNYSLGRKAAKRLFALLKDKDTNIVPETSIIPAVPDK